MGKNTFWWNIPANISVRCNSLCVSLCFCLEQPLTQKATFSIKWLRVGFPCAAFTLRSSRWPVWTRSRCLQNQLFCFLSFFLTPPPSLSLFSPVIPPSTHPATHLQMADLTPGGCWVIGETAGCPVEEHCRKKSTDSAKILCARTHSLMLVCVFSAGFLHMSTCAYAMCKQCLYPTDLL